jgi:galactokinase
MNRRRLLRLVALTDTVEHQHRLALAAEENLRRARLAEVAAFLEAHDSLDLQGRVPAGVLAALDGERSRLRQRAQLAQSEAARHGALTDALRAEAIRLRGEKGALERLLAAQTERRAEAEAKALEDLYRLPRLRGEGEAP